MATKEEVISVLKKCFDPEIPINIYDLGLVYNIDINEPAGKVDVRMTLTAPGCPASAYIQQDVKRKLEQVPGVKEAAVNIVWDPPWTPELMSESAKKQFGWGI
ncbi:MAG: aromatic ring hydroxylase [Euryarchaeota archaeon RBG_16_68_13]|nr:MAG: aromatic ring hydroxylase [Euryarchaeota archaeon RBG_16_68_13]